MFKPAAALTALLLIASPAIAEDATSLTVTIEGIKDVQGTINLGVFNQSGYDGEGGAVNGAQITVDAATVTATIEGLAPGTYGIKLYQDVNDNGQMDTNPFGMPTEPYAFSNNAKGRFGPAKWDQAAFEVSADGTSHTITMN